MRRRERTGIRTQRENRSIDDGFTVVETFVIVVVVGVLAMVTLFVLAG